MRRVVPLTQDGDAVVVEVWVVPGSSREKIGGIHDGALRVRVRAPAEGGRANRAAADAVAAALGGRRGRVVSGVTSRRKRVRVEGVSPGEASRLLAGLLDGS